MLVLSRRRGQQIVVPSLNMAITVLSINGKAVRLGISAPDNVAVHRQEVWSRSHQPSPARPPKG
jgi:carbon storage regulator